jgi:hypothetical protein
MSTLVRRSFYGMLAETSLQRIDATAFLHLRLCWSRLFGTASRLAARSQPARKPCWRRMRRNAVSFLTLDVTTAAFFDPSPSLCGLHRKHGVCATRTSSEPLARNRSAIRAPRSGRPLAMVGNHIDSHDHGVLCNLPGRVPGRGRERMASVSISQPAPRPARGHSCAMIVLVGLFAWTGRCLR